MSKQTKPETMEGNMTLLTLLSNFVSLYINHGYKLKKNSRKIITRISLSTEEIAAQLPLTIFQCVLSYRSPIFLCYLTFLSKFFNPKCSAMYSILPCFSFSFVTRSLFVVRPLFVTKSLLCPGKTCISLMLKEASIHSTRDGEVSLRDWRCKQQTERGS